MAKFTVKNTTILHNQTTYGVGSTIKLTDDEQIAKLAEYITPIEEDFVPSSETDPAPKTTKSGKKAAKNNSSNTTTEEETNTEPTSSSNSNETEQEGINGTEIIQTDSN